jgi:acyl-[acyl-carrier-protein]-phospholipid O-acyltransferase/long-chain-fatty-acid--[acyl-carrier-protein] ligase
MHDHPGKLLPPRSDCGDGWYDTGDIVNLDEDGFVTLRGRTRRFVKIGGEMVSLTHLESLAGSLWPQERHVAITLPDPLEGEQLVLLTTRYNATRSALLKAAQEQGIGEIHIPKQVIVVCELPLQNSGRFNHSVVRQLAQALIAAHPRTLH